MNFPAVPKSVSSLSKSILILSVSLAFAAFTPAAFAQRGGGGRVGGHIGGFHGGSVGHASGAAGAARGSFGSAGRAIGASGRSGSPVSSAITSTRGYSRNTFVPESATRDGNYAAISHYMPATAQSAASTRAFAADNRLWEDPPQQGRPMPVQVPRPMTQPIARPFFAPATPLMRTTPHPNTVPMWRPNSVARPLAHPMVNNPARLPGATAGSPFLGDTPRSVVFSPLVFNPALSNPAFFFHFHPIGGCFNSFNCSGFGFGGPFFNPFFFGFGFGPCFTGGFGCGFGPFGSGDLAFGGFGFGNGWFYPPAPEIPAPPVNPTEENPPLNFAPNYYFLPEVPYAEPETAQKPTVKLVLKDGTIFDVYSYWLDNNQLFYVTTYNIKTSIPVDDLDLQKTVDLNQKLGVTFTLGNKPPDQQQQPR